MEEKQQSIKVLIVDDVLPIRENLAFLLGLEPDLDIVGSAENGSVALEKVQRLRPDVVLMDINMPEMNGIEATELICQKYPDIAVIILSIQEETAYHDKAIAIGAAAFLTKPPTHQELVAEIHKAAATVQKRT